MKKLVAVGGLFLLILISGASFRPSDLQGSARAQIDPSVHFLTLPFSDPTVKIQQGWYYTDGNIHKPKGAIDYIKGDLDTSSTWQSFDVIAAADGVAMQSFEKGYGNVVLIRHIEEDAIAQNYFTMYAHLGSVNSVGSGDIPFFGRHSTDFNQWVEVKRGEVIGRAGRTGRQGCIIAEQCIHLHFEVFRGGYFQNQTDSYDLDNAAKRDQYPCDNCKESVDFRTGSNFTGCGPNFLWTQCPPVISLTPSVETLSQYKADGTTAIPIGGTTREDTVVLKGVVSDPEGNDVGLEVEIRPLGTGFTGTPNCAATGGPVPSGGTGVVTCSALDNDSYHWQGRARNSDGVAGAYLRAGQNPESDADFVIAIAGVPPNDNFADALPIDSLPFSEIADLTSATLEPGEQLDCPIGDPSVSHTIWYRFTPSTNVGLIAIIDSGFEVAIVGYTGPSLDALTRLGCVRARGQFQIPLPFPLSGGTTHYLQVASTEGVGGLLDLEFTQFIPGSPPIPPNDHFADATVIAGLPFSDNLDITSATIEPGEPLHCSSIQPEITNTIWYRLTPTTTTTVVASIESTFTIAMVGYSGSTLGSLTRLGCVGGGGTQFSQEFPFQFEGGVTHYIQVAGILGVTSDISFEFMALGP